MFCSCFPSYIPKHCRHENLFLCFQESLEWKMSRCLLLPLFGDSEMKDDSKLLSNLICLANGGKSLLYCQKSPGPCKLSGRRLLKNGVRTRSLLLLFLFSSGFVFGCSPPELGFAGHMISIRQLNYPVE